MSATILQVPRKCSSFFNLCIYRPEREEVIGTRLDWSSQRRIEIIAALSPFGKWVIQQQGQRGCAAAFNMFCKDYDRLVDLESLRSWNCRSIDKVGPALEAADLSVAISEMGGANLETLIERIAEFGSALLAIDCGFGSHIIIVDEIKEGGALIREPYHGLQMVITIDALARALIHSPIIQIIS